MKIPLGYKQDIFSDLHHAGVTGMLSMDKNGDRETDYSLWDMDPTLGEFEVSEAGRLGRLERPQELPC